MSGTACFIVHDRKDFVATSCFYLIIYQPDIGEDAAEEG